MTKCDCGESSHIDQLIRYPLGAKISTNGEFDGGIDVSQYNKENPALTPRISIPFGSLGEIMGHCGDGRAIVSFDAEVGPNSPVHTFHHPEGYFDRVSIQTTEGAQ